MIKYDEYGKIERATFEVVPTTDFQREMVKKFAALTAQQRAELIEIGFSKLATYHQYEADRVSG